MSDIKIQPSATGSGTVTITAPTTNTARVITLPDSAGTLLDENSSVPSANLTGTVVDARISALTASKLTGDLPAISGAALTGLTSAQMPAGSVLQVVQATSATETNAGTSATACAPTVTITPSASSSKILVSFSAGGMIEGGANSLRLQIKRGSTVVRYSPRYAFNSSGGYYSASIFYEFLDSPSTTSAITYTLEAYKQTNAGNWIINSTGADGTNSATAIAMEIKG
jgi:hypothetical protein